MTHEGAILEGLGTAPAAIDPGLALMIGIAFGVIATLGIQRWYPSLISRALRSKDDPLSSLFEGGGLDDQLARVADLEVFDERKARAASAARAKLFAYTSARRSAPVTPPHRAERFDHSAVINHIAKVMRAGTQEEDHAPQTSDGSGLWEEVLLLPAPGTDSGKAAKAA